MWLIQIKEENKDFIAKYFNHGFVPEIREDATFFLIPEDFSQGRIVDAMSYLNYTRGSMQPDPKSVVIEHV